MTNYINWVQLSQPIKGDAIQGEGNAVADYESPASGVASGTAPSTAHYATVWSTTNCKVEVTNLKEPAISNVEYALPANTPLQVFNVTPNTTTITLTDL